MSISFDPTTHSTGSGQALLYAVVKYLKSTKHLTDPVDHKPEHDGQYRLVCLAPDAEDAALLAHLLRAMDDGTYWYSVCVAEPESCTGVNEQGILGDNQAVEIKSLNPPLLRPYPLIFSD